MLSMLRPSDPSSLWNNRLATATRLSSAIRKNSSTASKSEKKKKNLDKILSTIPFLLYALKKSNTGVIENQLVVLYWDGPSTNSETAATEPNSSRWIINGHSIPVGFSLDTESIAFAVAICNKNGVQFFDELTCVVRMNELGVSEQAKLQNNFTNDGNFLQLCIERKAPYFLEIKQVSINLNPISESVKKLCIGRSKVPKKLPRPARSSSPSSTKVSGSGTAQNVAASPSEDATHLTTDGDTRQESKNTAEADVDQQQADIV